MTRSMTNRPTTRALVGMTLAAALGVGLSACGDEAPESGSTPTDAIDGGDVQDEPTEGDGTEETVTETVTETVAPPAEETEAETETVSATSGDDEGADDGDTEGDGEGQALVQEYTDLLLAGDAEGAYGMLSAESEAYFVEASELIESAGMPEMIEDLSSSENLQWTSRPAYEETYNSAQAVTAWGNDADGEPFAYAWAARTTDDGEWVVDQDRFEVSTGANRVAWLNPGAGEDPTLINADEAPLFGLTTVEGIENVAVNATVDGGDVFVGDLLTELPTEGVVQYELTGFDYGTLDPNSPHALTVAFVAEDEPFVHVQATGFTLSVDHG